MSECERASERGGQEEARRGQSGEWKLLSLQGEIWAGPSVKHLV